MCVSLLGFKRNLESSSKPGINMFYPEPCKAGMKKAAAAIYGWDCPLLLFIYSGFDCGSHAQSKHLQCPCSTCSFLLHTPACFLNPSKDTKMLSSSQDSKKREKAHVARPLAREDEGFSKRNKSALLRATTVMLHKTTAPVWGLHSTHAHTHTQKHTHTETA